MDTLPEIKPDVNREEREEKKGGLAVLLGKLGLGGGSGAGGLGGLGAAAGGAASGGGLLATKAGIIALGLIGTTVAGSVGVVGYKVFGPGSEAPIGDAQSLFEARPASERVTADAAGSAGSVPSGASGSLQMFVNANNKPVEAPAEAVETETADAPADQTVTANGSTSHMAVDNNRPVAASKLKTDQKFGTLSKGFGSSGGSGGSASFGGTAGAGSTGMLASAKGITSNMGAGGAARAAGGGNRGIAGRRMGSSALRQLKATGAAQRRAGSSQQAGSVYDGSGGPGGSGIGGHNAIGAGGQGMTGAGAADGKPTTPTYGADDRLPDAPPSVEGVNVTPYQAALNTALLCITGALALCMLASYIVKNSAGWGATAAVALGAIAAGLAGYALMLGMKIGNAEFGQPLQGGLITVAASFALVNAGMCMWGGFKGESGVQAFFKNGNMAMLMKIAGGGALLAMAGAYMAPKKQFDASLFEGGRPPDYDHDYKLAPGKEARRMMPSEEALHRYLA